MKKDWYRTQVDKTILKELTKRNNWRGLIQCGSFLCFYLISLSGAIYLFKQQLWIPLVIVCYVHSILVNFMGWGAAVHELSHGTVFKTKWINELFLYLFSLLSWNNPEYFRVSHTNHHLYTLQKELDKEVIQIPVKNKLNWRNLLQWFTFDFFQFKHFLSRAILHAMGKADADYFMWRPLLFPNDPRRRLIVRWARVLLIFHIVVISIALLTRVWILLYLVTFSFFFASFYTKLCGALQHTGLQDNLLDWRLTTHTFEADPITRFLYWKMNYHIEHHMYASIPFYNLPKLHAVVKHDIPQSPKSIFEGITLLFWIKKKQSEDHNFRYVPQFPPTARLPSDSKGDSDY